MKHNIIVNTEQDDPLVISAITHITSVLSVLSVQYTYNSDIRPLAIQRSKHIDIKQTNEQCVITTYVLLQ